MENQNNISFDEDLESFKHNLKRRQRIQKIIISAIPAALVTIMWLIIIIINTVSSAKRAPDKFNIEVAISVLRALPI